MEQAADLQYQLDQAMRRRDIQEIGEVLFDIKAEGFHKMGLIDISEAEDLVYREG